MVAKKKTKSAWKAWITIELKNIIMESKAITARAEYIQTRLKQIKE